MFIALFLIRRHRLSLPGYPFCLFGANLYAERQVPIPKATKEFNVGVAMCLLAALLAWASAQLAWNHKLQLSPLTLAIVAGMALGNALPGSLLHRFSPGL